MKLNVGGSLHYTTIGTLTKHDTMLRAMFSGRMEILTDSEGWVLIDRCGKHFGIILNFLRDGQVSLPENPKDVAELLAEAKYYCITGEPNVFFYLASFFISLLFSRRNKGRKNVWKSCLMEESGDSHFLPRQSCTLQGLISNNT